MSGIKKTLAEHLSEFLSEDDKEKVPVSVVLSPQPLVADEIELIIKNFRSKLDAANVKNQSLHEDLNKAYDELRMFGRKIKQQEDRILALERECNNWRKRANRVEKYLAKCEKL